MFTDDEDDFLMLSGIQHIAFCERQFALAYIEMQWDENRYTVEGHYLHTRVDNPFKDESRGDVITLRAVPLKSKKLRFVGKADVVEFTRVADQGIPLKNCSGLWRPYPVEYKRGNPKPDERDEVQLCAQAICLEEMFHTEIQEGAIYYGETRHRSIVNLSTALREKVLLLSHRMHELVNERITPPPIFKPHCRFCSLIYVCLPQEIFVHQDVNEYLAENFDR